MATNDEIPGMTDVKYASQKNFVPEAPNAKEMDKTKKDLEKIKDYIVKKHKFVEAIGILPPQAIKIFIEDEEVPKETEKHIHLAVIIPEEQFKNISKIKKDIVDELEKSEQKIWLHLITPVDIWEYCMDGKFDIVSSFAMAYPVYDKGILGALRVSEIHKSLVLRKFEKYVVSYVIGGSLVRGEAVKTSDVDVFVIINDTDVKRMPRLELKEKLRGIIYQYISEAAALAGVKNVLNVQVYLLTDFWESVKDAHPVIFTFIRDGVPLYDRGTFMPWKALLKMGKLKPSPEAIDMFMSMGDKTSKRVKRTLLDLVIGDIYWGVLTPSQAMLMLYGLPPPNVKETVKEMKRVFVDKEKMLEKKYTDILEEIAIKYYKGYEHEKVKEVSGAEVDRLLKNTDDYLNRLKELREQIEKKAQENTVEEVNKELFNLLENIFGKKSSAKLIEDFETELVKKGKMPKKHLEIINEIVDAKKTIKSSKKKAELHKIDKIRRNTSILINDLIDYTQRKDLINLEKGRMRIKYKDGDKDSLAEVLSCGGKTFLFRGSEIHEIDDSLKKISMEEVSKCVEAQKGKKSVEINSKVFEILKKELGKFEIFIE